MGDPLIFDHYEVLQREDGSLFELGRGAMGTTYKAFDTNLRVPVALKVINAAFLESEVARQRFVREARSAAQLRHRNVASVFHLGTEEGSYFYAMEFIDGETVDGRIRREGALEPVLALNIAAQVARALGAAERLGLVHRDIKPSNLMLVHEDEELVVKVIDFGLAKSIAPDEEAVTMTSSGFVGTPHFASPEQLDERETDVRSDLYSLGATLWYMLAGRAPFAGSLAQVMSQHLHKPPPFELFPQWPQPVIAVLQRMLEKDVTQRVQTPGEAREALEQAIAALTGGPALEFPTLIETPLAVEDEFTVGQTIGGKYEVLAALGESTLGLVYQVQSSPGESRRLTALPSDLGAAELASFQTQVRTAGAVEHANLLRPLGVEVIAQRGWLLEDWSQGFTFAELLRARRELPVGEVLTLLEQAVTGVEAALAGGLEHLPLTLPETFLDFGAESSITEKTPVSAWQSFVVKLRTVQVERSLADSATWAGEQTLVSPEAARIQPQSATAHGVQGLSALAYELLGGQSLAGALNAPGFRYVPLASLSEQGNDTLKRGLDAARSYTSAGEWWQALQTAEAERLREAPPAAEPQVRRIAPSSLEVKRVAVGEPSRAKSSWPLVAGAVAVVALVGAGYFILQTRRLPATPLSTPTPSTTPAAVVASTPIPTATPVPTPTRDERMRQALDSAQVAENARDWPRALTMYLQLARDFPEQEVQLELLASKLRSETLTAGDFSALRDSLTEAARRGTVSAMMLLADRLRKMDPTASYGWYSAAAQQGKAEAMMQAGVLAAIGAGLPKDAALGARWFQGASDAGNAAGTRNLAVCYLRGEGVPKDVAKGVELLQKAVAMNDAVAMDNLGHRYQQGDGVPQDYAQAAKLFAQAHDLGYPDSFGNLGVMYLKGWGVPTDLQKAVVLFGKGAEKGSPFCMRLLAQCYEDGRAVAKNMQTATSWYRRAAAAGEPAAMAWCRENKVSLSTPE